MEIFKLFGSIFVKDEASKELDKIDKKGSGLSSGFKKIGGVIAGAFAVAKVVEFGKKMIEVTANLQAMDSQFNQIFKGAESETALKKINEQSEKLGIHGDRLKSSWNKFGAQIKGVGVDGEEALNRTETATRLAADAAAFFDMDMGSATDSLASFLKGNFEAGDALGVFTNATQMSKDANAKFGKSWQDLTEAEKQDLLLEKVDEVYKLNGAQGQASREMDNWSNVTGNLKATWERFLSVIGSPVLKIATKVVQGLAGIIEQLQAKLETFNVASWVSGLRIPDDIANNFTYFVDLIKGLALGFADVASNDIGWIFKELQNVGATLTPILTTLADVFINVLGTALTIAFDIFTKIWDILNLGIQLFLQIVAVILENCAPAFESIGDSIKEFASIVLDFWNNTLKPFIDEFIQLLYDLWSENQDKISLIGELFKVIFEKIAENVKTLVSIFKTVFLPMIKTVVDFWREHWDQVKSIFQGIIDVIAGIINVFIGIFTGDWQRALDGAKSIVSSGIKVIKDTFQLAKDWIHTLWSKLTEVLRAPIQAGKDKVISIINGLKSSFSTIIDNIKSNATTKFTEIKSAITKPIETAVSFIKTQVDKIKGFFSNLKIKLPKIKLPHFSVSGSWDLVPPSLSMPKIGVEYYKDGGILTQPTIFGMNGNKAMVGGDAGAEAVLPIEKLEIFIYNAFMQAIKDSGLGNMQIVMNEREVGRAVTPTVSEELAYNNRRW